MIVRLPVAALLAVMSAQAMAYDAAKAPRYGSPDMYRPNVDRLIINGPGSTGDMSTMSTMAPLANATLRSLAARAMDRPSILDFVGVDPTGTINSRPGIMKAVDAFRAAGKDVSFYFPCGKYLIGGGTAVFAGVGIDISAFKNCVTILNGNAALPAMQLGDPANPSLDFGNRIEGLTFASAPGVVPASGQYGLVVYRQGQFNLRSLKGTSIPGALYAGIRVASSFQLQGGDFEFQNTLSNGIEFSDVTDAYLTNLRSDGNANNGFQCQSCQGSYLVNLAAYNNGNHGIAWINGGSYQSNVHNFVVNAIADTSGSDNWYIQNLSKSVLTNVWGSSQKDTTSSPFSSGFLLTSDRVFALTFNNPVALSNNYAAFRTYSDVTGSPFKISVVNPTFGSPALGDGKSVPANGNGVGTSGGYGIVTDGTVSATFMGGSISANISGPILNTSTGRVVLRDVAGFNPVGPKTVTVGASPFTYKAGVTDESVCLFGGTVSNVATGGVTLLTSSNACIPVGANDNIVVTYSAAPNMSAVAH